MPWETLKSMFRPAPGTVHMGVMRIDSEKCTHCGLCFLNCPLRAYEVDEDKVPHLKEKYECLSCYNCMVACPVGAISIVSSYYVESGFYATGPHPLPFRKPLVPRDADGKPDKWNEVEKVILERRSVRNYLNKKVPEHLVRRVLEAGRFAPSAGNCQPWKFIVITNQELIDDMNKGIYGQLVMNYTTYRNDGTVQQLVPLYEQAPAPGGYDPRVILGGIGSIVKGNVSAFLNAPIVILLCGDKRAIGGPQINIGICGENMNLVAKSLGLGACWVGFSQVLNTLPSFLKKLGIKDPWEITNAMVLGYPKFKQEGMVPREFRPVAWYREGSDTAETEES